MTAIFLDLGSTHKNNMVKGITVAMVTFRKESWIIKRNLVSKK